LRAEFGPARQLKRRRATNDRPGFSRANLKLTSPRDSTCVRIADPAVRGGRDSRSALPGGRIKTGPQSGIREQATAPAGAAEPPEAPRFSSQAGVDGDQRRVRSRPRLGTFEQPVVYMRAAVCRGARCDRNRKQIGRTAQAERAKPDRPGARQAPVYEIFVDGAGNERKEKRNKRDERKKDSRATMARRFCGGRPVRISNQPHFVGEHHRISRRYKTPLR